MKNHRKDKTVSFRALAGLVLLAGLRLTAFAQETPDAIDVQHYRFALTLNDKNDTIKGMAAVRLQMRVPDSVVTLDLTGRSADGKGMAVSSVTLDGQALAFLHTHDRLRISLPKRTMAGDTGTFMIRYEGIPADGLIIARNKYGDRGFFADNWPDRARNWLPSADHPSDKATVDFFVTAPAHYEVISNGIKVDETSLPGDRRLTHYREGIPLPTKIMVIGVADFAIDLAGKVGSIPVYSYVYPENKKKGFYDYGQATEILPFYIQHIGPYPFEKLANVQSKTIFGGMENAGAIFYSEKSVTGTRRSEALLAHEIAHQWFGDMVTETGFAHLWLSEGFATYMTILYLESKYGEDTLRTMLIENREQVIAFSRDHHHPVVDSAETHYMNLLNANSYQKGGWVLHMLRCELGDSTFWRGIRRYYARYAGKNASTGDFEKVMEAVSGKDLGQFFRQWLFTAGQPDLDIAWKYDKEKKTLYVKVTQKQPSLFRFPLELGTRSDTDPRLVLHSFSVRDRETSFSIPLADAPRAVLADPRVRLLFEGKVEKE